MNGNLGDKLAADLIRDIANRSASGLLRLTRGKAIKAVFFESGAPIFAISNQASEQLDHVLLQKQLATLSQLEEAKQKAGKIARLGHALVEMAVVSHSVLHDITTEIAKGVIYSIFEWTQGEYTFDERVRAVHEVKLDWSAADCILEGARHTAHNEQFARAIAPDSAVVSQSSSISKIASTGRLSSAESYVLSMVSTPTQVRDIASMTGLPEEEIRVAVCALLALGLLRKGTGPEESEPEVSEADESIAQLQAEIARKIHFFSHADYYEVLGVTRRSTLAEIKSAYYALAKKFHPDRFRQPEYADLRLKLEAVFAKMTQAYETLGDRVQKALYDDKLKKSPNAQSEPIVERPRPESLSSRPMENRPAQPKPAEPRPAEVKHAPPKPAEPRADETRHAAPKPIESPAAEPRPSEKRRVSGPLRTGNSGPITPGPIPAAQPAFDEEPLSQEPVEMPEEMPVHQHVPGIQPAAQVATHQVATQHAPAPGQAENYYKQGRTRIDNRDYYGAVQLLREAVKLDSKKPHYHYHLGMALLRNPRTRREGEFHLVKAAELDPFNAQIRVRLGLVYKEGGLPKKAEHYFREALTIDPDNKIAQKEVGGGKGAGNKGDASVWKSDIGSIAKKLFKK